MLFPFCHHNITYTGSPSFLFACSPLCLSLSWTVCSFKKHYQTQPPPELPSEIPCKFTSKFEAALSFFPNSETLSSTLLSLCRFCVTCRVLEGVLLYIKNRLLEASSVTIQVKSPSNKLNQFNDFKKRNFQPILPSIAEKNPSKTDTLRKWKQQIHLLLKSIKC